MGVGGDVGTQAECLPGLEEILRGDGGCRGSRGRFGPRPCSQVLLGQKERCYRLDPRAAVALVAERLSEGVGDLHGTL